MDLLDFWYLLRHILGPFVLTICASVGLTYVVRNLTRSMGLLDRPGQHKQHAAPTPTLGGLPVFIAFSLGAWLSGPLSSNLVTLLAASLLLVSVGVVDDIWGVRAKLKLTALFFSVFLLWREGIHLDAFGLVGFASLSLTFLWIGLVSSAFNGVDNADGAAAGLAVISAAATFWISWQTWQHDLAVVSLILAGACIGFLVFNFPMPVATIFLGDSGSLFLGFGLASITVLGEWSVVGWKAACVAVLLVFVPLFDFLFILISRGLDGRYRTWEDPIKMCGRDHLSHRLRYLGFSPRQVLVVLYGLSVAAGYGAFLVVRDPAVLTPIVLWRFVSLVGLLGVALKATGLPPDAFVEE